MIDTILFDFDGTLLSVSQKEFFGAYFIELRKVFSRYNLESDLAVKGVMVGTKAMVMNDGKELNSKRFWEVFSQVVNLTQEQIKPIEAACDRFYSEEFDTLKYLVKPNDISRRIVRALPAKGYTVVLATNPMFPEVATKTRLKWLGLELKDFKYISHYANSSFCKPNLGYYRDLLKTIDKTPPQCIMVGNNPAEDMCVQQLSMESYLVMDCLENESNVDITKYRKGFLADLESFLTALPNIDK